jgi:glycosyltransferase involved in cell wall biosynthesis
MEQKSTLPNKKVSVIISAYNRDELTCVHVRECQNSTYIPDEIIVVDDCGEEGLKEKLQKLEKKTEIIYARILPPKIPMNYTGARNLGLWLSTGGYISVEDNDHIPERTYYQDCINFLEEHPECQRLKTIKRHVVSEEDVLTKPFEEWTTIGKRPHHEDVSFNRRELLLQLKGYDERFAGEYGWCSTDINRRLKRLGAVCGEAGYQYVVYSEKTRGLSYRNFRLARTQTGTQSPSGILNFQYTYCKL